MRKDSLYLQSLIRAIATVAYVTVVALIMSNANHWFPGPDTALTPVFVLLLFVISATVTGFLILGQPVTLYLDGKKKEAFAFLAATVAWLAAFLVFVGILLTLH